MDYKIELYRGQETNIFGTESFMSVIRESLQLMGLSISNIMLQMEIRNVPEDYFSHSNGIPIVENAVPEFGYLNLQVFQGSVLIYQHPHSIQDIITNTLQLRLKKKYPKETFWRFRIDVPGMPRYSSFRKAPNAEGSFQINKADADNKGRFVIKRVEDLSPPLSKLSDFGIKNISKKDRKINFKVLIPQALKEDLCKGRVFSNEVEEGGFLIGKVFRDQEAKDGHILELTAAVNAKHTGASFLHFTFTGDSFVEAKRTIRQNQNDERMLGWFHTHLFPATPEFGLSSIDFHLHFNTFTFPWQLAGLINLEQNGRTLRFYAAKGNDMILVPHYII